MKRIFILIALLLIANPLSWASTNMDDERDGTHVINSASGTIGCVRNFLGITCDPDSDGAYEASLNTSGNFIASGTITAMNGFISGTTNDPSLVMDVATTGDTDFWLGVQDDADGVSDDKFQIGLGSTAGTTPIVTIEGDSDIGIGDTTPDGEIELEKAENGVVQFLVTNTTAGTSAQATFAEVSDTASAQFSVYSGSYTGSTDLADGVAVIANSNAGGGLALGTNANAPIRFYTNGTTAGTADAIITSGGSFGVGFGSTSPSAVIIGSPPAAQTIAAGNTITANACGTLKSITATGAVTTDTTNTFTAPATANAGCVMHICNTGANNITLDNNANFKSFGGLDVLMTQDDCVSVISTGTSWYQVTPLEAN